MIKCAKCGQELWNRAGRLGSSVPGKRGVTDSHCNGGGDHMAEREVGPPSERTLHPALAARHQEIAREFADRQNADRAAGVIREYAVDD